MNGALFSHERPQFLNAMMFACPLIEKGMLSSIIANKYNKVAHPNVRCVKIKRQHFFAPLLYAWYTIKNQQYIASRWLSL